jgi:hypothetical protein
MANVTRTTGTYTAHTNAAAADVESDVSNLYNTHNLHDAGTSKWTVVSALNALATPLIADNSTGTNNIVDFKDNGTIVWAIADGGNLVSVSKKITGLAAGTANGDAVRYEQNQYRQAAVVGTTTTTTATASTTYVSTAITASITPTSASSRIKVTVSTTASVNTGTEAIVYGLSVGGSDILANGLARVAPSANGETVNVAFTYISSPATTSATAYLVRIKSISGTTVNDTPNSVTSSIILEELI